MSEEILYCVNHPSVETSLRCNRCGNPICPRCAVQTPVGFRCKDCIRNQQAVFYSATTFDYVVTAVLSLVGGVLGAVVISMVGWFFALFLSPLAGGIIAELVRLATGHRRGRYTWLVAGGAVAVAALFVAIGPAFVFLLAAQGLRYPPGVAAGAFLNVALWIYVIMAVGAVIARLR
jgi:MFS family permease